MKRVPLTERTSEEVRALSALTEAGPLSFGDLVERGVIRSRDRATVRRRLVERGDIRRVGPVAGSGSRAAHCSTCRCPRSQRRRVAYEVVRPGGAERVGEPFSDREEGSP